MPAKRLSPAVLAARKRLRRRRRRAVLTILLLVLLVMGGFAVYQSDYFLVERIEIHGLNKITAEEVKQVSGIESQMLIWRVQSGELERKIKSQLPRVDSVKVTKRLPDLVAIQLVERIDAALLPHPDGGWLVIDATGMPIDFVDQYPGNNLPIINGLKLQNDVPLGRPMNVKGLDTVMLVVNSFARNGAPIVSEIIYDEHDSVTIFTQAGLPVYFGSDGSWDLKVQALLGILEDLRARNAQARYIDLRSVYRPVLREK
mgnify:CR=1 FL=1